MSPAISLLYGAANVLLRRFGVSPQSDAHHVHSPEELRLLVMQARAHGTLDETDSAMLAGVFDFHEKKAYDVMRPRTEVAALDIDSTRRRCGQVVRRERYSRYPVYRDTLDDVIGVFLAKDLWLHDGQQQFSRSRTSCGRRCTFPSSKPAERVLDDLRKTRAQMAVVLDEYGGTAGIVTMEDLVEEVVGDIADEYDFASRTAVMIGRRARAGRVAVARRRPLGLRPADPGGRLDHVRRLRVRATRPPARRSATASSFPGGELEIIALEGRRMAGLRVHRDTRQGGRDHASRSRGALAHGRRHASTAFASTRASSSRATSSSARASRSGGAGGQHVNTSSTRIELVWNVAASRALDGRAARARAAEAVVATGRRAQPARRRERSAESAPEPRECRGAAGEARGAGARRAEEAPTYEAESGGQTGASRIEAKSQRQEARAALARGLDARRAVFSASGQRGQPTLRASHSPPVQTGLTSRVA